MVRCHIWIALAFFIVSIATTEPVQGQQFGRISAMYQKVNGEFGTNYYQGDTINGKSIARVSVKGAESPDTLFRLKASLADDWAQIVELGSDSKTIATGQPDTFLIVELEHDVLGVPPSEWYDFYAELEFRDPETLTWVYLDFTSRYFSLAY